MFGKAVGILLMEKMPAKLIRIFLGLVGIQTWDSWSGFGISTSWPQGRCGWEIGIIKYSLSFLPKEEWVIEGPTWVTGGVLAVMAWPVSDPQYQTHLRGNNGDSQEKSSSA